MCPVPSLQQLLASVWLRMGDTSRHRAIARSRRRSLAQQSGPPSAALLEQLLADQLLAGGAAAARASLLALSCVASTRRHLACTGRASAQIVLELGQRERLQTLLRRIIRSSSGDEVRVVTSARLSLCVRAERACFCCSAEHTESCGGPAARRGDDA